jgi:MarR-like DNA-binding transcriptional regulator SgrR of sgrS sRNA
MRPIRFLFLAAASLFLAGQLAAATRPRYGGTLHIETRARLALLDPAKLPAVPGQLALANQLLFLTGDRLVRFDSSGHLSPSLALHWRAAPGYRDWTFDLRPGVKFQDGKPMLAGDVVAALTPLHPLWHLRAVGLQLTILLPQPEPDLLLQLALPENSILRIGPNGLPIGTGPFRITRFTDNRITLVANNTAWQGRPFLNGVVIRMGRASREQWIDLELGRADLVQIPPDRVHRAHESHVRVWTSQPNQLVALVFDRRSSAAANASVRQALAGAVDRSALRDVLLQKQGEVARAILPSWLTGYSFLFTPSPGPATPAVPAPAADASLPKLSLAYDASDSLLASFAARIAVDARAVGLRLQLQPQPPAAVVTAPADVRLVRQPIESLDPAGALQQIVSALGLRGVVTLPASATPDRLYAAEKALLATHWLIPLVDLPEIYGLGSRVKDWMPSPVPLAGGWRLAQVWKEPE